MYTVQRPFILTFSREFKGVKTWDEMCTPFRVSFWYLLSKAEDRKEAFFLESVVKRGILPEQVVISLFFSVFFRLWRILFCRFFLRWLSFSMGSDSNTIFKDFSTGGANSLLRETSRVGTQASIWKENLEQGDKYFLENNPAVTKVK